MDARREELLRWVNEHWSLLASNPLKSQAFTQQELGYAEGLRARLEREGAYEGSALHIRLTHV